MTSAIVLAAGKGTRMVSRKAKAMHRILDRPMLEYTYQTLRQLDVEDIVFVVGYGREEIEEYFGDKVHYAVQEPQLGSGHAVMQAEILKNRKGKTLIINGDCPLIRKETYEKMLAMDEPLVLLTTVLEDGLHYGRIVRDENGHVEKIVERKDCNDEQAMIREINAGIYCADNELLWQYLPEIGNDNAQKEYYVTDLVEIFNRHGHKVGAVVGEDFQELSGINNRKELAEATGWMQKKINNYWMEHGVSIVDPRTAYIGCDVVIGEDTIIHPNVSITGKTVIGCGNIITENSVIENSVIGNGNVLRSVYITGSQISDAQELGPWIVLKNAKGN